MKPTLFHAARHAFIKAALFAAGLVAAGASCAQSYQFVDLGSGSAYGINDSGTVVGGTNAGATIWRNGVASLLAQGANGYALGINNQGEIIGGLASPTVPYAAVWSSTPTSSAVVSQLNNSTTFPILWGINNAGVIVGDYGGTPAVVWQSATAPAKVLSFPGPYASATGINDSGVIVGNGYSSSAGFYVPVEWNNGTPTVLPSATGGEALAVNNAGVVVGSVGDSNTPTAAEWKNGALITLPTIGGAIGRANAINSAGVIVGYTTNAAGMRAATLWNGTSLVDLNHVLTGAELGAGWTLTDATGINNQGWIVGEAYNYKTGANDAFELEVSPVPEPGTCSMLLAGAGLIGAALWRRKFDRTRRMPTRRLGKAQFA